MHSFSVPVYITVPPPLMVCPTLYPILSGVPKTESVEYTTITGNDPNGNHDTFTSVDVMACAAKWSGSLVPLLNTKLMVFRVVFSTMSVIGFSVFSPAHDIAAGVVLSVNDVFFLVPGNGHALEFTPP